MVGKNKGKFVYFREGVYAVDGYGAKDRNVQYTHSQPVVLMAMPGHGQCWTCQRNTFAATPP